MPLTIKDPFRTPYGAFKGPRREPFKGVASATPKSFYLKALTRFQNKNVVGGLRPMTWG